MKQHLLEPAPTIREYLSRWLPAALIGGVMLAASLGVPQNSYFSYLICLTGVYLLVVLGFDTLYGLSGQISLGQAGFFGTGAYGYAILTGTYGVEPWFALLASIAMTGILAFGIGLIAVRLVHHLLAFLTIGFAETIRLLALNGGEATGGFSGIANVKLLHLGSLNFDSYGSLLLLIWIIVGLAALLNRSLKESTWGRSFVAVRDNRTAAEASGCNVRVIRASAFTLSALYAGIGGVLFSQVLAYVSPDSFTIDLSTQFLVMLLIGGVATGWGPLTGTVVLVALTELLQRFAAYQGLMLGALLIGVVMLFPRGIVGSIKEFMIRRGSTDVARSGRGTALVTANSDSLTSSANDG